jgi:transcriptional regulator with XRE-family HTH domain
MTRREDLLHRVARRIASARRARGISQEGLAARLGIAVKNLQRIESGRQNLTLATIDRICRALDVPAELVLAGTHDAAEGIEHAMPPRPHILARLAAAGFDVRSASEPGRPPSGGVPVTTLRAAAGRPSASARIVERLGWVVLDRRTPPPPGQFIAEVVGRSMEPRIPSGSLCLFGPPGPPPYGDRILLVAHASLVDDELGGPYALKRVRLRGRLPSGKVRVVLESTNRAVKPIVLDVAEDEVLVLAELVRVIVRGR